MSTVRALCCDAVCCCVCIKWNFVPFSLSFFSFFLHFLSPSPPFSRVFFLFLMALLCRFSSFLSLSPTLRSARQPTTITHSFLFFSFIYFNQNNTFPLLPVCPSRSNSLPLSLPLSTSSTFVEMKRPTTQRTATGKWC